jgi:hypothetical protein
MSRDGGESVFSFDGFHTPDHRYQSEMGNVEVDINGLSMPSNDSDELMDDEGDLGPSISSVNSSEAIIRRVEEEIANARKAAQEANRRLAGVSANLKDAKSGSSKEVAKRTANGSDANATPIKAAGESRNPSPSVNVNVSNEEDDALFDSAMNIIGEEFDLAEENELFDMPAMKRDEQKAKIEASATSNDDTESEAPSTTVGSNPLGEVPDDERRLESMDSICSSRDQNGQQHDEQEKVEVPMSPSEEIDSLLRDASNEGHDNGMDETENSGIRGLRSMDVEAEDIKDAPSEEIKTPATTKTENKSKQFQHDKTQYLATQSIDDASVGEKEIRGSKDSLFEEAGDDDNLLEWLPIGVSTERQDSFKKQYQENTNQAKKADATREYSAPMDEMDASTEQQSSLSEASQMPDDETSMDETKSYEDKKADPIATKKVSPDDNSETQIVKTEVETVSFEAKDESKSMDNQDHSDEANAEQDTSSSKDLQDASKETEDEIMKEMPAGIIYSDVDSLPDAASSLNKEENDTAKEGTEEDPEDLENPVDHNNTDVFIYQVVSAASGEAITEVVSGYESKADIDFGKAMIRSDGEKVAADEAIEVVAEPIHFVEDPEEVNQMNASDSESDQGSKIEVAEEEEGNNYMQESSKPEILSPKFESQGGMTESPNVSINNAKCKEEAADEDEAKATKGFHEEEHAKAGEERMGDEDDDQVTQIMRNKETEAPTLKVHGSEATQVMDNIEEAEMIASERLTDDATADSKENVPEQSKIMNPIISSQSPVQAQPSPVAPSSQVTEEPIEQPTERSEQTSTQAGMLVPSQHRKALVENRRAVQSRVDEARNAMCGETNLPVGLPNPTKDIVHRAKKVKFKQRYPVPPPVQRPLQASEIIFRNQTPAPKDKLNYAKPKKDLKELLEAAIGDSIQRRSNAFGALKVLSTQKKNKVTLVRTKGFLDATVYAINDDIAAHEDFEAAVASRTRAVNVILNVSEVKENRYHVFSHPGLAESLVKCMVEDKADARAIACSVLATIAKSATCREPISNTHKLIDTLAILLKGSEPSSFNSVRQTHIEEEKKDYSGDDEASRTVFSGSYSSGSSADNSSIGSNHAEARNRARLSACAALLHLSKECSVAQRMCMSTTVLFCLVETSNETDNPLHTRCLEIISNLTRFPQNNAIMTKHPGLVNTLIMNGNHKLDVDRLWSMRALQNLSSDSSSKTILATNTVLELLSVNIMRQKYEEQHAAIAALYNISTEPGAVVPLTNTKNVVATLVHVAHNPISPSDVRLMACDTLATLGLWLQTLAGAGTVPAEVDPVPLPTYVTSGWKRWEK